MKKIILFIFLLMTTLSMARDFDYRAREEFSEVKNNMISSEEKMSRMSSGEFSLRYQWDLLERDSNRLLYSGFLQELDHQDRGREDN